VERILTDPGDGRVNTVLVDAYHGPWCEQIHLFVDQMMLKTLGKRHVVNVFDVLRLVSVVLRVLPVYVKLQIK